MTKARTLANLTLPSGTPVGTTDTQTLTNKTLTAPTIASANLTTALTIAGAAGSSGNVLTSGGSGAPPTWAAPSSGAMVLAASATASSSSSIVFNNLSSSYRAYMLEYDSVYLSSAGQNLLMTISTDNGSSYLTANYARSLVRNSGTLSGNYSNNDTVFYIGSLNGFSTNSAKTGSGIIYIFAPNTSGKYSTYYMETVTYDNSNTNEMLAGSMTNDGTTSAVNAVKFASSSGTITAGNFRLYALVNA